MSAGADAPAQTRLVLVRHGETVWHADNRYAGTSDVDLTEAGQRQAHDLVGWSRTRPFVAVVTSPVRRAHETARPAAEALGVPLEVDEDLREVDFGLAEGRTVDELLGLDEEMVRRFREDPVAHPFPGAESPQEAARRGVDALRRAVTRHPGGQLLVVAHNTLLRMALCSLLGLPVARYRQVFPRLENTAVTELLLTSGERGPAGLLSLNVPVPTTPVLTTPTTAPRPVRLEPIAAPATKEQP